MIFDVAKFVIWLIDRYDLHEQVLSHIADSGEVPVLTDAELLPQDEPVQVQPKKPYLMHFEEEFVTGEDLKDKMIECCNSGGNDNRAQ